MKMEMTMVKPEVKTFRPLYDYDEKEAKRLGLFKWRKPFIKKYARIGFPTWKRLKLSQVPLGKLKTYKGNFLEGNASILETFTNAVRKNIVKEFQEMPHYGAHPKFTLMSQAFFTTGFFIKSLDRSKVYAHYDLELNPNTIENSFVVVKSGSELTLVREITGKGNMRVSSTKFLVEDGAKLNFFNIFISPDTSFSIDSNIYNIGKDANVKVYDVLLGGKKVASNHEFNLVGMNAAANLSSFYFETGQERADLEYKLIHDAPETTGYLEGNGVVNEESYVVFRGNIWIPAKSYGVKSREKSHAINLSPKARVDAIPSLSVRNNAVNAEHAASIGNLDDKKLYYMMSRGLSREEALKTIIEGMFEPLMRMIPIKSVKKDVKNGIISRI